jgi:ABC transport system ATP-binding/permease protein
MTTNFCPHCGTPNTPQARFCIQCGKAITTVSDSTLDNGDARQMVECPHCHKTMRASARYCPSCGEEYFPVQNSTQSPVAPPPAAKDPPVIKPQPVPVEKKPIGGFRVTPPVIFTPKDNPAAAAIPAPQATNVQHAAPAQPTTAVQSFAGQAATIAGQMTFAQQVPSPAPQGSDQPRTQLLSDMGGPIALMVRWMGGATQSFPITTSTITVGRAPDNDVVINHPAVSARHLRLAMMPDGVTVTDLGSTNGTQLNGHLVQPDQPNRARVGDVLRIGDLNGNWVSLVLEGAAGQDVRTLSLGSQALARQNNMIIGRDPNCYLPLNHPTVSFRHAEIYKRDGELFIRDLGSTNGTFVNGLRIAHSPLKSGDQIAIGPFKLSYDAQQQSLVQSIRLGHRIDAIQLGREVAKHRLILDNVTLTIEAGEFVALVGGSGAGKSTLMKAMNGYEPATQGQLLLDGEPLYSKLEMYRTQMGYVPQDDIIHRVLPVRKALWYAAKLRLPDARPEEIEERIQDALTAVDLTEHADKPVRVLSGGQRKRVSIAVELLARPTLFFLDEPTSGLDPGLEKRMMYDLNRVSDEGRTVVLVTHATANIEQCDLIAFMASGSLAYFGPPNEALKFFDVRDFSDIYLKLAQEINGAQGIPPPPELQPYYRPKPGEATRVPAGKLWAEHYRNSAQYQKYVVERQSKLKKPGSIASAAPPPRRAKDSMLRQTVLLARRQFDLIRFDWRTLFVLLLMVPMVGALLAAVSHETDLVGRAGGIVQVDADLTKQLQDAGMVLNDKADYLPWRTANVSVTMLVLALTQAGTFGAAYEIVKERAIFKRERTISLSVIAYVSSKLAVLSAFGAVQVISFLLVMATVVDMGFRGTMIESGFLEIAFTLYLAVLASIALGLFISAIVPSSDVVLYAILVQLFAQLILSGTMIPTLKENAVQAIIPAYWSIRSVGSTVDVPKINQEARICSVVEVPNPNTMKIEKKVVCNSGRTTLSVSYKHQASDVRFTWWVLIGHVLFWTILTMIVLMRRKTSE